MEWFAWVALYAVALVVFQVLVYRYLWTQEEPFERRTARSSESEGPERARHVGPEPSTGVWTESRPADVDGLTGDRSCPHCGETNEPEPMFTFCRNCAGRLA
ncbi:hypothetical protein SAMN04487949_3078 [Halogranum gelatinilyticum]|uniref:DUF7577 domain-containing protein n=1 Tax=Halogranum gelatinilyticum TaxID=660521 RepID=A0A1G9XPL8_9EURY|nr:hypothetical protein [Halogranum gelatinilyticum]SDM98747.1 hypothetical protein SAMN04487949_3078 [Halogranum gelatinilyticum]